MRQDAKVLTGIDVGTTKVCTVIGRKSRDGGMEVLGYGVVPCDGLSKGNVADVAATAMAIRSSIVKAEEKAGVKVQSAYIGVTGTHVSFENRMDKIDWLGKRGVITLDELVRVPEVVASSADTFGREVIHAIPMRYYLDGKEGVKDPLGMHTRLVEVETHMVTGASGLISKLQEAVQSAGLHVEDLVLEPLASSEAVLTEGEKNRGAALIDIGGGTTDVVVYKGGTIYYTGVIPVGGYQFTNDIVVTYNTTYQAAEEVKLKHATVEAERIRPEEEFTLPVMGKVSGLKIPRRDLCQLMRERTQELIRLVGVKLKEAGVKDMSEIPLVLTGGASNMPGLVDLFKKATSDKVRLGVPNGRWNTPEELTAPSYSTGVGILLWALHNEEAEVPHSNGANGNGANGTNGHAAVPSEHKNGNGRQGGVLKFFRQMKGIF